MANLAGIPVLFAIGLAVVVWIVTSLATVWLAIVIFHSSLNVNEAIISVLFFVWFGSALFASHLERRFRRQQLRLSSSIYRLGALSAYDFQSAVEELFRLQGYEVTPNKRPDAEDGGVDLELVNGKETLLVQVKHSWAPIGVRDLRELFGIVASEHASGGIFVTIGGFTLRAEEFAACAGLRVIDGKEFLRLRSEVLPIVPGETPEHDPLLTDGFARYFTSQSVPNCENCGKPMELVTKLSDLTISKQFWGCRDYPACQGARRMAPYLGEPSV